MSLVVVGYVGFYDGSFFDSFLFINRDVFVVRYDKVYYLNALVVIFGVIFINISSIFFKLVLW